MPFFKLVGAAAVLALAPFAASAEVINFDVDAGGVAIASNAPVTNQYAGLGVTFVGLEDGAEVPIVTFAGPDGDPVPSTPNALTNCSNFAGRCADRADIVRILFGSAVSGVSLQLNSLGSQSITFNLYDAANILLESQSVTSPSGAYVPVTFTALGVRRIDGLQPNDEWAWALDNLSFTASDAPVPEPATWAMMIGGFGMIGGAMRRRAAKAAFTA